MRHRIALGALVALAALIASSTAWAHARVSPPTALANESQVFTLAVPTEKDNAATTTIEMTPPKGFSIDSFVPSPGWKRTVQQTGSGEEATVTKVTWAGGTVPTGEDATFSFLASTSGSGDYTFDVKQTYSDGSIVDWSGPESSDSPAPVVKAVSSFGGGTPAVTWVALILGIAGLVLGGIALLVRSGRELA
jgi:uncharacterized protein YcnI